MVMLTGGQARLEVRVQLVQFGDQRVRALPVGIGVIGVHRNECVTDTLDLDDGELGIEPHVGVQFLAMVLVFLVAFMLVLVLVFFSFVLFFVFLFFVFLSLVFVFVLFAFVFFS